ncbi:MAG TPA: hypothetical protein PKI83_02875 [Bacteroidales bacterium]|nr:hypothetical protein [Bacteroidales bacterium]
MAQTKKQEKEVEKAMQQKPPKYYNSNAYPFTIRGCPGYNGYTPENLNHEVCKYCGAIKYYH